MSLPSNRPVDWEAFVIEHENRLYRAALAILGNPQEAEDAVQDAFVAFWQKAPTDLREPDAWLMRVLINSCRSRLRSPWRRRSPLPDGLAVPGPEARQELEELQQLRPEDRTVIHLFYFEQLTTAQIARLTGWREGTVRSRLTRARSRLKRLLTGEQI